jgi:plasmid stabilization system protein ParE
MKYTLVLRQEAERDLAEAYGWYETCVPGLGADFLAVVEYALDSIKKNPDRFPLVHHNIRRALTRRFPYGVFFVIEGQRITVLDVMHTAREPGKWRLRSE